MKISTSMFNTYLSHPLTKKVIAFMGVELIIAVGIVGMYLHTTTSKKTLASAPVDVYSPQSDASAGVLGAETDTTLSPTPYIVYKVIEPSPTVIPNKKTYKIAIIGDSFEDTMGETGEYLQKSLKTKYQETDFLIYNYGKGATTVKDGLESFDKPFKYGIRNYPSVPDLKPDMIIIGSYANNPPDPYDRNWHWITYTQLVQKAQKVTPNIYMLAEVAPLREKYGDGPNGVNWEDSYAKAYSGHVLELMENILGLSKSLNVPLIDVYSESIDTDNKTEVVGKSSLISVSDGIHPSQDGHELIASKIADTVKLN